MPQASLREVIQEKVKILQRMTKGSHYIDDECREKMLEALEQLAEKVEDKPMSLADIGAAENLEMLDRKSLQEAAADPIEFDEEAIKQWKVMCWLARFDMSEDEMLLLTEKTMKKFVSAYGHQAPHIVMDYWRFLVKRYAEIKKAQQPVACKKAGSEAPKERHAGAVKSSGFLTSQRSEACPDGIEAYNYTPEVSSPTAQMWKQAPRTPDGSSRRGTSTAGSRSVATRSVAARSMAAKSQKGDPKDPVQKTGWQR